MSKSVGFLEALRAMTFPKHFFVGLGIFLTIMVFVILSKKLYEKNITPPEVLKKAASLVRKSADSTFIAQQTNNPLLAMANVNDATTYLNIARDLVKDEGELTQASKIPVQDLQDDLEREQKYAQEKILKLCPQVGATGRVAAHAGFYSSGSTKSAPQKQINHTPPIRPPMANGVYSEGHGMFTPL